MKELWKSVGFVPVTFELNDDDKAEDDVEQATKDAPVISITKLPPIVQRPEPNSRDIEHFNGITVRNLPPNLDDKDILGFLINYGMPTTHANDHINISKGAKNTCVVIDGLNTADVQTIFKSIHFHKTKQKFFDANVPLYCKPLRNMTPKKQEIAVPVKDVKEATEDKIDEGATLIDNKDAKKKESENTNVGRPKPIIPGLPEEDRLKQSKNKKKKKKKSKSKEEKEATGNKSREDFLLSPESGMLRKTENVTEAFEFSDYDDADSESDDSSEEFEDSKETFSDNDHPTEDFLTPVSVKSTFAKNLIAKSTVKPSSTPCPSKRSASSPADEKKKQNKKSRARSKSMLPRKK